MVVVIFLTLSVNESTQMFVAAIVKMSIDE